MDTLIIESQKSEADIRDAFFDALYELAGKDPEVVFLTADMGAFSLNRFKRDFPDQYINVGVSEQNLISVAAGLALDGWKVFVYAIAPFITQRCYEQIKVDLCCMNLPVTIIGVGAGIAYSSDGPTHHATQDIAVMRALPNMAILNPCGPATAAVAAFWAYQSAGPVYIRIEKGGFPSLYGEDEDLNNGLALLKKGRDITIISTGIMTHQAFKVAAELGNYSIDAAVVDLYRIKPINTELLLKIVSGSNRIVTLEEHSIIGGIGSAVSEILTDKGLALPIKRIGIPEKNCSGYGDRDWMHSFYGLDIDGIEKRIIKWINDDG